MERAATVLSSFMSDGVDPVTWSLVDVAVVHGQRETLGICKLIKIVRRVCLVEVLTMQEHEVV